MECKKHIQTDKYENKKKLNNIDHDVYILNICIKNGA